MIWSMKSSPLKSSSPREHSFDTSLGSVVDELTTRRTTAQQLRNVLRANAFTSTIGGLVCLAAGGWTSTQLGTGHAGLVRLVGVGLIVFGVDVAVVAGSRVSRLHRWAPIVSAADALWVVATLATIAAGWYSAFGAAVVCLVGLMVGSFGVAQLLGWRRLKLVALDQSFVAFDEVPPIEVAHVERCVAGSPKVAWQVVTDHELYGRLAPNLSDVHVQSGTGADLVRVCSNNNGDTWTETCSLWKEGEQFEVNVRTDRYPYPLAVMRGSWWVRSDSADRTIVGMDFRYRPRPGIKGFVFAAVMQAAFPFVLRRILSGWQHEIERRTSLNHEPAIVNQTKGSTA